VFAAYLNTSPPTVQKWEQGQKMPNGPSLKLLNLVDRKGLAPESSANRESSESKIKDLTPESSGISQCPWRKGMAGMAVSKSMKLTGN
jgi:hypothetical protein